MKKLFTLFLVLFSYQVSAQTGILVPQLTAADAAIGQFVQRWDVLGASVAICRNGRLVYARGFGAADRARTTPMQPHQLLRVASLSKPVTALAIMKLVQEGQMSLSHKVFGPAGYLTGAYYTSAIQDARLYDITVQHLLEHSAGWDRAISCDGLVGCDPIDFPLHVTRTMQARNPVGDSTLIRFLLTKGLNDAPGTHYAYSNVGYLILGKVLEQVTHQRYEAWVEEHLLRPSGVLEAHLARNQPTDQYEREGEYESTYRMRSCYGTGRIVPETYGGVNLEAMNAHGGWIFSARDLLRLLAATTAGSDTQAPVLTPATVATMTTPSALNPRYAKGWMVNGANWWHTGNLDGSTSYLVRTGSGFTWAILLNTRHRSAQFWQELDALGWTCMRSTTDWPTHDLFPPTLNASQVNARPVDSLTTALRWANGNGTHRLVIARADEPVNAFPLDGTSYQANSRFGEGPDLGNGNFVVFNGTGNSAKLHFPDPNRLYYTRVVEYRQDATTQFQPVYTLEGNPVTLLPGNLSRRYAYALSPDLTLYPSPVAAVLNVQGIRSSVGYEVLNGQGQRLLQGELAPNSRIRVESLPPGLYLLRLQGSGQPIVRRFIKE